MAFLEARINSRIERGAQGGPTNRGRVKVYTVGGNLRQQFGWTRPLSEWDISHGMKTPADAEELLALWHVVNFTPFIGFRFRDWSDYRATAANSALRLISGTTFQLQRAYTFASQTFKRDIVKPDPAVAIQVLDAGGTALTATVDYTTGQVVVASGTPATWVGFFDVPVTFADNEWVTQLEASAAGPLIVTPTIKLEELRSIS